VCVGYAPDSLPGVYGETSLSKAFKDRAELISFSDQMMGTAFASGLAQGVEKLNADRLNESTHRSDEG